MTNMERKQLVELIDGFEKVYRSSPPIVEALGEIKEILEKPELKVPTREQVEAWSKCNECTSCKLCLWNKTQKCNGCKNEFSFNPISNFCPRCGMPLTYEAVEIVMERLEALYETKAD